MRVMAVIPARNEAATLADLVLRAGRHVQQVIVVDDASGDGTAESLRRVPGSVILRNAARRGKAGSLWRGMQYALAAGCEAVITLDGDGQHRPEDIPALIAAAQAHPNCLIIGARLHGRACMPWLRRAANRLADICIARAAGRRISDSQSGFRLYPAGLLRRLSSVPRDRRHGFVWESEVLIEAAWLGHGIVPVVIDAIYDPAARPSHYRAIADTLRIARMLMQRLSRRPGVRPVPQGHRGTPD